MLPEQHVDGACDKRLGVGHRCAALHGVEDRVRAPRKRLDLEDLGAALHGVAARTFAERSLRRGLVGRYLALQHELRLRRHFQIDGLAARHAHRFAQQSAGDGELVGAVGGGVGRGEIDRRVRSHGHRDRHGFVPCLVFLVDAERLARADQVAGPVGAEHLHPVDRHVADAGIGILDDRHAGGDVRARVGLRGPDGGDAGEVDLGAARDDLLDRGVRARDLHRRDRAANAVVEAADDVLLADAQRDPPFAPVGDDLVRDPPAREAHRVGEQARLAEPVVRLPADGGEVLQRIDRLFETNQLSLLFQLVQVTPNGLIGHAYPRRIDPDRTAR